MLDSFVPVNGLYNDDVLYLEIERSHTIDKKKSGEFEGLQYIKSKKCRF